MGCLPHSKQLHREHVEQQYSSSAVGERNNVTATYFLVSYFQTARRVPLRIRIRAHSLHVLTNTRAY